MNCLVVQMVKNLSQYRRSRFNPWVGKNPWRREWLPTPIFLPGESHRQRSPILKIHWKDWCWNWNSNSLATWCEEPTHWKRPWCWERLKAKGEGGNRGWAGWMALPTQWTWVWASSGSTWKTGSLVCCSPSQGRDNQPALPASEASLSLRGQLGCVLMRTFWHGT